MDGLLYGGYFVKEKTAPEGFKLDENAHYFEISEDGKIVDVENEAGVGFINQPITGKLELTKTDVADGKPLPNAGFRIKDEDGNIVATGVTDENGIAIFTLRYGNTPIRSTMRRKAMRLTSPNTPLRSRRTVRL